jgi:hypothetical protein
MVQRFDDLVALVPPRDLSGSHGGGRYDLFLMTKAERAKNGLFDGIHPKPDGYIVYKAPTPFVDPHLIEADRRDLDAYELSLILKDTHDRTPKTWKPAEHIADMRPSVIVSDPLNARLRRRGIGRRLLRKIVGAW